MIALPAHATRMRILIAEVFHPEWDDKPYVDVSGRDGTLQKELKDFEHWGASADSEFAHSEVSYAIEFRRWEEWLGMEIDPVSLRVFDEVEIIAHCLWEMTFAGFDQETIQEQIRELEETAAELNGMTEEELKKHCRPLDILDPWDETEGEEGEGNDLP